MRPGKIPENVLKRSVLRQIQTKRDEIIHGADLRENCAVFSFSEGEYGVMGIHQTVVGDTDCARLAIYRAANNLAAAGAQPVAVELSLLLPAECQEPELRRIMEQAERACLNLNIQLAGGSTKTSPAVQSPVATVVGIGKRAAADQPKAMPGQDIVITKWIGLEGTAILAKQYEQELLQRYPADFIREAKAFDRWLSVIPEAATAGKSGTCRMYDCAEGGIFGALWEFGRSAGVGLELDLKKLPVKQETIEICEYLEKNPYELLCGGALLIASDNGYDLVRQLKEQGISATVAGKVTDNHDRIVINEEERRFLDLPKTDEIYK